MARRSRVLQLLFLLMILACGVLLADGNSAAANDLPPARNLADDGLEATRSRRPVLLFFTLSGCPFCERARREYLSPRARGAAAGSGPIFREVAIESSLVDFDGRRSAARDVAARFKVRVFPTVLLVDGNGQIIAEPLVGIAVPDFYAAYLDQRIATAFERIRQ